jgi:hypothetical protein
MTKSGLLAVFTRRRPGIAGAFLATICAAIHMGSTSVAAPVEDANRLVEVESSSSTQRRDDRPSASSDIELLKGLHALALWQEQLVQARRDAEEELTKERQRADALVRDLETARSEQEQLLQARRQTEEELTKERQRAEALVRDLETARSEQEQVLQSRRQAEEELTKERQRAEALVRDLETARSEQEQVLQSRRNAEIELNHARTAVAALKEKSVPDVSQTGSLPDAPAISPSDRDAISRAEALLEVGNVAGARLVLEHGLRAGGSPLIAFRLAETYDPSRLRQWRSVFVRPDPRKARELYEQAALSGIEVARARIANLPPH